MQAGTSLAAQPPVRLSFFLEQRHTLFSLQNSTQSRWWWPNRQPANLRVGRLAAPRLCGPSAAAIVFHHKRDMEGREYLVHNFQTWRDTPPVVSPKDTRAQSSSPPSRAPVRVPLLLTVSLAGCLTRLGTQKEKSPARLPIGSTDFVSIAAFVHNIPFSPSRLLLFLYTC
ncbi:hypothetical protein DL89DRAFT_60800 [Linderina pennispora]|uniref:Uncharacterized protein n=1 Tax=Linderina pennispora TaxID=61395 RepID=A0A1Y1W015_9FUNG|nr:uncharacterized protein DL89DRAFT_60800 [Linderina pennispora]ORX66849.1 hypothetical protein DL89DRAFT_60800 [Linderina pennispora]